MANHVALLASGIGVKPPCRWRDLIDAEPDIEIQQAGGLLWRSARPGRADSVWIVADIARRALADDVLVVARELSVGFRKNRVPVVALVARRINRSAFGDCPGRLIAPLEQRRIDGSVRPVRSGDGRRAQVIEAGNLSRGRLPNGYTSPFQFIRSASPP